MAIEDMTGWLTGISVCLLLLFSTFMGYLSSPWAAFWLRGSNAIPPPVIVEPHAIESVPDVPPQGFVPIPGTGRHLSDRQRFDLARIAGWTVADAIIATAISIAENGSGDPAALSGQNRNGTRDLGMWQINTLWWAQFGGQAALTDRWNSSGHRCSCR
jgi:hypothetical protein